jgi:hypothetical protein
MLKRIRHLWVYEVAEPIGNFSALNWVKKSVSTAAHVGGAPAPTIMLQGEWAFDSRRYFFSYGLQAPDARPTGSLYDENGQTISAAAQFDPAKLGPSLRNNLHVYHCYLAEVIRAVRRLTPPQAIIDAK